MPRMTVMTTLSSTTRSKKSARAGSPGIIKSQVLNPIPKDQGHTLARIILQPVGCFRSCTFEGRIRAATMARMIPNTRKETSTHQEHDNRK